MQNVSYQFPASRVRGASIGAMLLGLAFLVCVGVALGVSPMWTLSMGGLLFGINTTTYVFPVAGVTAPTAVQAKPHQMLIATITGDNSATTFSITHNWALTAAEIAAGFPIVIDNKLLAAGYTSAWLRGTSATNAIAFTNTAFTGVGLQITLLRPWTAMR